MAVELPPALSHKILRWYDANARDLPWRTPPGAPLQLDDPAWPYRVWLSEVMLQQTTVAAVTPYYERFLRLWPDVAALAGADDEAVMREWAGLGYYARARNMLACARAVAQRHGGRFPDDETALRALPGIGPYTAAAIIAFAFGQRAVVVDGNIERVVARLTGIATPLPDARPELRQAMDRLTPDKRAGDFAQAMMDLGARICVPRNPLCAHCPAEPDCTGKHRWRDLPARKPRAGKPERSGTAWWIERGGEVLLVRRAAKGLLGGMRALPSTGWDGTPPDPPLEAPWRDSGEVRHVFTHFALTLCVKQARLEEGCNPPLEGEWWPKARLEGAGLPALFAKAARIVLGGD